MHNHIKKIVGAKYLWQFPNIEQQQVLEWAARYNLSPPIAQTLLTRGLQTEQAINDFLFSTAEKAVAHASLLKDAQKAVDRILHAIKNEEKILVFGDYDVDGITSSAMMMACLLPLRAAINFYLPNRRRDGYGLSTKVVNRAADNGYSLIITVDNGITAFEPTRVAKKHGIDVIITDHHRQHAELPDAFAIVNPNQHACSYPFKALAGVGVAFKVLSLLYEKINRPLPAKVYELLLLGTIADVVPLLGENRFWVRHGLAQVNRNESFAFSVLKRNGKVTRPQVNSSDIGYGITPQINALGRLEDPRQAVKFLIGTDSADVERVGSVLLELNQARKEIERSITAQVVHTIETGQIDLKKERVILAASTEWQPGVIGLVASRLVNLYGRPVVLFHLTSEGQAKGSCRSIPEFNMFDALTACQDMLISFGGHSLAAGLALEQDKLPLLKQHLEERAAQLLTEEDLQQKLVLDAPVQLSDLTKKFLRDLAQLEPFGHENKPPTFLIDQVVQVQQPTLMKGAHVKCRLFADGVIKPVVFFNRPELFPLLQQQGERPFSVAAQVSENHWNGRVNIELIGADVSFKTDE